MFWSSLMNGCPTCAATAQATCPVPRPRLPQQQPIERTGIDVRRERWSHPDPCPVRELTHVKNAHATPRRAQWRARRVALAQARVDRRRSISAASDSLSVDGVVARRQVQLGQRVQPSTPCFRWSRSRACM